MTHEHKVGPFRLEGMPRDQAERLREVLAEIRPPRRTYRMTIVHQPECPCEAGRPPDVCDCDEVDVICESVQ